MTKFSGHYLQTKGARLRENDKHTEALRYLTLALVMYQNEKRYRGIVDALKDRCLTWKHFFLLTKDKVYAVLAQKDAEAMLEISRRYKLHDKFHTSYFRLGEVAMLFEDFNLAEKNYQNAVRLYEGPLAEKGDYRYHLGEALYKSGKKQEGKEAMLDGLEEIRKGSTKVNSFLIHVWESGAHMRLADLLRDDEPKEAKKHLKQAGEIANSDPELVIRRRQVKELAKKFRKVK